MNNRSPRRSQLSRRSSLTAGALAALALLTLAPGAHAQPAPTTRSAAGGVQRFDLRPTGQSRVAFTSDAPLETVDGVATQVVGGVTVDVDAPSRTLSGRIAVQTTSIRTGVDLRDEHLRGPNWLDANRFPEIVFELAGTSLTGPLAPNAPARGTVRGRFTLHGVTRDITAQLTARRIPLGPEHAGLGDIGINADMLRIQAQFSVRLTDFGVSVPTILQLKVSNEIQVRVDLTAFRRTETR